MTGYDLPTVNAALNGTATVLLVLGYASVKSGRIRLHKASMLAALATSAVFLASYLTYHFAVRGGEETKYTGEHRAIYLCILLSHIALAPVATLLALITAWLALTGRIARHRLLARITLPIWLYVSITGVVVYLFLKDLYPTR